MRHSTILAIILFLTNLMSVQAQNVLTLSGTVIDSKGEPVIGAAILLERNPAIGAVSDENGRWSLSIPNPKPDARLEITCLSYEKQVVDIKDKRDFAIVLDESVNLLDELVVVGYGSMRRSDLTGAVSSVKIDEGEASRSTSLDQLIAGKASGVDVVSSSASPDAPTSIRIRGVTSLNGSSEPLYVIDGVILTEPDNTSLIDEEVEVNGLMGINPQDIANIEILKDASATAIYGAAGANGVVLITTKEAKSQKPVINLNIGFDVSTPYKRIDVLTTDEYFAHLQDLVDLGIPETTTQKYIDAWNSGEYVGVDWQDYSIRKTAFRKRVYLSVSGKKKELSYSMSLGYNSSQGLIKTTGNDQYTARLNLDKKFNKWFRLGGKVNFSYVESDIQQGATASGLQTSSSLLRSIIVYRPFATPSALAHGFDDDDDLDDEESRSGPAAWLTDAITTREEFRVIPTIFAQFKIVPWLNFKSQAGLDLRSQGRGQWKGTTVNRSTAGAAGTVSESMTWRWQWDNTFNFNQKWGKHSLSGTLGMTMGRYSAMNQKVNGKEITQYALWLDNINSADVTTFTYTTNNFSFLSFFARAVYNYADRYVLTATYRCDGSSKFQDDNKFGHFPSAAFAWRVNKEPWFKVPVISMLKLRVGYGLVGNSTVANYQTYSTYSSSRYANHLNESGYDRTISVEKFQSPDLKWETTSQVNGGIDMGFWKGRLVFSLDLYYKNTYDLLQKRYVPYASGFDTRWMNVGAISNRGFEFSLESTPVKIGDFEWQLAGNISLNRNRLESIGFDTDPITVIKADGSTITGKYYYGESLGASIYLQGDQGVGNIFMEGQEIGLFYGYKTDGIIQEGHENEAIPTSKGGAARTAGQINYVDLNGNGYLDEGDRTIIGNPNAKFNYGFNTTFSWKGLTFSAVFQGVYGRDIYNVNLASELDNCYRNYNFRRVAYTEAWTSENPSNKYMKVGGWDNTERYYSTDRYIEDGSYLRLSSVTLGYNFRFRNNKVLKSLYFGLTGKNLIVFTSYSGWDPDVSSFGSSMSRVGCDIGSYPSARTYCADLRFTF